MEPVPPALSADWVTREPGWSVVRRELGRLLRRAGQRLRWVLLLALAFDAIYLKTRVLRQTVYSARVEMTVAEGALVEGGAPAPNGEIRNHVLRQALSDHNLLELMERLELGGDELERDPKFAVENFRENFNVVVWRNEFLEMEYSGPRSVHLAIEVFSVDPEWTAEVANALGQLVIEEERGRRLEAEEQARARLDAELEARAAALQRRVREAERLKVEAEKQGTPDKELVGQLLIRNQLTAERFEKLRARRVALGMALDADKESLGLQFQIIEPAVVPERVVLDWYELVLQALLGLLVSLFFVALAVGALDPRVHDGFDLQRAGLLVLAEVPGSPGEARRWWPPGGAAPVARTRAASGAQPGK